MKSDKGLSFVLMTEEDAIAFLEDKTFFFKLKSFAKNYDKRFSDGPNQGKYINLDFGRLVELSRLDAHARSIALSLSLDIEHYLKIRINKAAMAHAVDPCSLTESFLQYVEDFVREEMAHGCDIGSSAEAIRRAINLLNAASASKSPIDMVDGVNGAIGALDEVTEGRRPDFVLNSLKTRDSSTYSRDLAGKYHGSKMPYWVLMELMSFGPLIKFYKYCFGSRGCIPDKSQMNVAKRSLNLLRNTQSLRNAAAHGDCLMNGLNKHSKSASRSGVKRLIVDYGVRTELVTQVGSVPLAMDFAALLMCYDLVVSSERSKKAAAEKLKGFSARLRKNREWFSKSQPIGAFIDYMIEALDLFADRWDALTED